MALRFGDPTSGILQLLLPNALRCKAIEATDLIEDGLSRFHILWGTYVPQPIKRAARGSKGRIDRLDSLNTPHAPIPQQNREA